MDEHRIEGDSGGTSALKDLQLCGYKSTTPSSGWVVGVIQLPKSYPHSWPIPTLCKAKITSLYAKTPIFHPIQCSYPPPPPIIVII